MWLLVVFSASIRIRIVFVQGYVDDRWAYMLPKDWVLILRCPFYLAWWLFFNCFSAQGWWLLMQVARGGLLENLEFRHDLYIFRLQLWPFHLNLPDSTRVRLLLLYQSMWLQLDYFSLKHVHSFSIVWALLSQLCYLLLKKLIGAVVGVLIQSLLTNLVAYGSLLINLLCILA